MSSNGGENSTGIVWATTTSLDASNSAVPGTLRAYNANDISKELYDSDRVSTRDAMGTFVKMSTPVVLEWKGLREYAIQRTSCLRASVSAECRGGSQHYERAVTTGGQGQSTETAIDFLK